MLSTKINRVASLLRRASILIAIGTVSLALAAAAPASAAPSATNTATGKKGRTLSTGNGYSITIDDGQKLTITTAGGKKTFECKDGKWVEVRLSATQPISSVVAAVGPVTALP